VLNYGNTKVQFRDRVLLKDKDKLLKLDGSLLVWLQADEKGSMLSNGTKVVP
jgi:hypothetical protein